MRMWASRRAGGTWDDASPWALDEIASLACRRIGPDGCLLRKRLNVV